MFELLTLAQTDKLAKKIVIILYGSEYWNAILNFDVLVEKGAISPNDRHLFRMADTVDDAFAILQSQLTEHHLDAASRFSEDDNYYGPEIAHTR
jgi:predicted Rossmann-fold nucleotide-binding protein